MAFNPSPYHFPNGTPTTVIATGRGNGIGARITRTYQAHGCNAAMIAMSSYNDAAHASISTLSGPPRALYQTAKIVHWSDKQSLFRTVSYRAGQTDNANANAGFMELFYSGEDESVRLVETCD